MQYGYQVETLYTWRNNISTVFERFEYVLDDIDIT